MRSLIQEAFLLFQKNKFKDSLEICLKILKNDHNNYDANNLIGVIYFKTKKFNESAIYLKKVIQINPNKLEAYNNYSLALCQTKNYNEALKSWNKAIDVNPQYAEAYFNIANVYSTLKDYPKSIENYNKAIEKKKNYKEAYNNLGSLYAELNEYDKAIEIFKKAILIKPVHFNEYNNLANVYYQFKEYNKAIENYNIAINLNPNFALGYYNRAKSLEAVNKKNDAISDYNKAITLQNNFSAAYKNLGNLYMELKILDKSIYNHQQSLKINPNISYLPGTILQAKCGLSDWNNFEKDKEILEKSIINGKKTADPFPVILIYDSPFLQRKVTDMFVQNEFVKSKKFSFKRNTNKKIRIGYYSSDFHNHATMYLMANLFELHDKTRFEIYAFSFGPDDNSEIRERVAKTFDKFFDVKFKTTKEIVHISRELNLDIAIDLKGFTKNNRFDLFVERCAPIQISYLGFPGTTASDCIDYLIADKILIPEECKSHYSENIIYLPNSYQVNDSSPKLSKKIFTKKDFNLPEKSFIFCCFNHNYKILPDMFETWIRILTKVKNSVIWLLIDDDIAKNNLRKILISRNINPDRLIFANRVPHSEHLVRLGLADLFLDTFPCNAHTTASDAIRSNLPLITLKGKSFASRVASSLLSSVGLEQLITETDEDYEQLAIKIAEDKTFYNDIKNKLKKNVINMSLFDTKLFTKNLETAYEEVYKNLLENKKPKSLVIN